MHGRAVVDSDTINDLKLKAGYLSSRDRSPGERISRPPTPKASLIRLGMGDVTEPLSAGLRRNDEAGRRRDGTSEEASIELRA